MSQQRRHLTISQLVAFVVALLVVGLTVFIDGRDVKTTETASPVALEMPFVSAAAQSSSSWFCPGVPGNDGTISGTIAISNSSDADFIATITRLGNGVAPVYSTVGVPARSHVYENVRAGIESPYISVIVEIIGGVGSVEQLINHPAGNSVALCANEPATEWHFADGFTGADSLHNLVLTNPYSDSTVVDISFVTRDSTREPAHLQGFVIPPLSVVALNMAKEGARNEPVLAVSVRASAGKLVVGRSQHYLGDGRLGYTMALGSSGTSPEWWFADGENIEGANEQLVILNPSDEDVSLSVLFVVGDGSDAITQPASLTAPAGRVTLFDTGSYPGVPTGRYGMIVSTVDVPGEVSSGVVVEQVINRRIGNTVATSVVLGAPYGAASTIWSAPSGVSSGIGDALIVFNATPAESVVSVSQVGPAGSVALPGLESVVLSAGGLTVVAIPAGISEGEIIVQASSPVVVQRKLLRGHDLPGRSAVLAIPTLPSPVDES